MLRSFLVVSLSLVALTSSLAAQNVYVLDGNSSQVTFRAHVLATNVIGRSQQLRGVIRLDGAELRRINGTVSFPVSSLRMESPAREREVAELLGAPREPEVIFEIDSVVVDTTNLWSFHGQLTMRGTSREVRFMGGARVIGGRVRANGAAQVDIREWGVTPPTRFLGLIKMSPYVRLTFDAEFSRDPGALTTDVADRLAGGCALPARSC